MDLGFTVNKGSINGVREFDALPERLRRAMKGYANTSEWIQTDCTINHGNSGGAAAQCPREGRRHQHLVLHRSQ